jgi:transcriptional regulator with XRE-family HTH domain
VTLPPNWLERLREGVRANGAKQYMIAVDIGISEGTISRVLTGKHVQPTFETVVKIAHAAGVSIEWVLEEPGFALSDEHRAKVRSASVILLNLTGGLPKS